MNISFDDYYLSLTPEEKRRLAEKLLTAPAYLSQLANGKRNPSRRFVEFAKQVMPGINLEFPGCCED